MKILSFINTGNSFPIIVEDQGQHHFVKLRAGMSGAYGLVTEWIGNRWASEMGLQTQVPYWLELKEDLILTDLHVEVRDLVNKSIGINIAFKYLDQAVDLNVDDLQALSTKEKAEIYLFDLMMINIDRSPRNTNLFALEGVIYPLDYESSLLIQDLLNDVNLLGDSRVQKCLKHNPLYQEIEDDLIEDFLARAKMVSFEKILEEIPEKLLSVAQRKSLLKGIEFKKSQNWFLRETLDRLKEIPLESKEAYKARINKNQEDFKRRINKNLSSE